MTRLAGGVHPLARAEFDQGALDPSRMIRHVVIGFTRSAAQQQALEKLIAEQQDPTSPNYHNWLTPEQFAQQFGMSDSDLAKVKDWLVAQGFTIDEVARGHSYIAFTGSAGQINSVFATELHQYNVNGEVHFANATSLSIPSALAPVVAGIRSLNDFKPKPHLIQHHVKPDFTSSLSGNTYLAPDDFATVYNLNALYSAGIDGTGQKIAVMGQTDIVAGDITTFRSVSNLPANPPQVILIPGPDPGIQSGDIGEAALDLEWAGAVAPKATIIYVNSGTANGVFDSLYYAINNNTAPVISISYGLCEAEEISSGFLTEDENMLQQAATQGQTVVGPAGDAGAADCDTGYPATQGLAVDFPASSPYVTAVGGTTFNETTGVTYWSTVNDVSQGSALIYIPEVVWNDTSVENGLASTGGGVSTTFTKPSWQTGTGVPSDGFRDVPDIAFNAAPGHDGYITCVQGDCQVCATTDANCASSSSPGYRSAIDETLDIAGGTSAGVPTFSGMLALLNQKMGSPQGNINQNLYQLAASSPYVFHDITSGNNMVPCRSGSPNCPGSGMMGYNAGIGYDQATGLGSVDGFNLVSNWSAPAAADFTVGAFNSSVTVRNGSSSNVLLALRQQNGFSGPINLACSSTMPGVTCSVTPSTITPDGVATVTVTSTPTASLHAPRTAPFLPYWEYVFGAAAFVGIGKKRSKGQIVVIVLVTLALLGVLVNCGGGGSSGDLGGGGGTGGTGGTGSTTNLSLTPSTLTFTYQIGGTVPAAQNVTVGSTGSALNYTVTTSGGSWLSASPSSGSTSGTEAVSVNPASLAAGTYTGTVNIASSGAGNTPQAAAVTLNVASATGMVTVQATSGAVSHSTQIAVTVD